MRMCFSMLPQGGNKVQHAHRQIFFFSDLSINVNFFGGQTFPNVPSFSLHLPECFSATTRISIPILFSLYYWPIATEIALASWMTIDLWIFLINPRLTWSIKCQENCEKLLIFWPITQIYFVYYNVKACTYKYYKLNHEKHHMFTFESIFVLKKISDYWKTCQLILCWLININFSSKMIQ